MYTICVYVYVIYKYIYLFYTLYIKIISDMQYILNYLDIK